MYSSMSDKYISASIFDIANPWGIPLWLIVFSLSFLGKDELKVGVLIAFSIKDITRLSVILVFKISKSILWSIFS